MTLNYKGLASGSDIRGIALDQNKGKTPDLTPRAAYFIAGGFAEWLEKKTGKDTSRLKIAIGRDPRITGRDLTQALINGLKSYNCQALSYGLTSTPAMFMSTVFEEISADGAIMITASHLPAKWNGLKFFSADGGVEKQDIYEILTVAEMLDRQSSSEPKLTGSYDEHTTLMRLYPSHLRKMIREDLEGTSVNDTHPLQGLKIAVDAGNGSAGFFAEQVLKPLGCDVSSSLYLEPDGTFPNHAPNPEDPNAVSAITEAVKTGNCDLGLIFDTDVDRSSAIDEQGRPIVRNGIIALAAALIPEAQKKGATVVTDSVTSTELSAFLTDTLKMRHLRYKRGYRNVIDKAIELREEGISAPLAIETSGHAAYSDNYYLDDGAYLAVKIVICAARLKQKGLGISSMISALKEPEESKEIRMPITTEDLTKTGDLAIAAVKKWVISDPVPGLHLSIAEPNYEGIRINYSGEANGWFLLRKSLHESIMPLNIESESRGGCKIISKPLAEVLNTVPGLDTKKLRELH